MVILGILLKGTGITIAVTLISLLVGFLIGLPLAMVRVYGPRGFQWLAAAYGVVLRGFPSLVVLFLIYYGLARVINLNGFLAGCVALGVCSSAYQAEIFRGALSGVHPGQMMAARALGMSRLQGLWYVVLPQALRNSIAAWSNEAAVVVKDSSLVYAVGLQELMSQSQLLATSNHSAYLLYFSIAALIYFALTFLTNRGLDWIETKTRIPQMVEAR